MVVGQLFRSIYGITVAYDTSISGIWYILCDGDTTKLKSDLLSYGIVCDGELRKNVSISQISDDLVDEFMKRRFIAGLADTIGSTNKNHRRFTDEVQILSFELSGFNFAFVCELCRLLYSVNCLPDQILWNHPNFHSANNPYYTQWAKGFKLRLQLDQYAQFGAFAFKTKAESSKENRSLQQQTHDAIPCPEREVRPSISCVHPAENDKRLPDCIRGGHYLHNRHVCAVLGCENAPYNTIKGLFSNIGDLVVPFPILCKDSLPRVEEIIKTDPLLADRKYAISKVTIKSIYDRFKANRNDLFYGNSVGCGYPITELMQGIAYVIASESELNGTRPKGNYIELVERHLFNDPNLSVEIRKPDLLTPLVIIGNGRGVLVGARNPNVYKKLVTIAPDNEYKLCVRPITEKDLLDEK
jgi:hypothetical protein